jgi:hypothetical protein
VGWFDWFRPKQGPRVVGKSAGGSRLIHYDDSPAPRPRMDQAAVSRNRVHVEQIYGEFFGRCDSVFHEMLPSAPHVDAYVPYWQLVLAEPKGQAQAALPADPRDGIADFAGGILRRPN